ncbi:hypothetical protein GCM10022221_76780 [Actinocorallia aurea]
MYGLAPNVSTVALFYNKDMLSKADTTVPRTWDELKAASAKLTRPGRYGMAVDANPTFEGAWQFLPFLWPNGGDETQLDTPQAAQALQLWVDLVKDGSMSKSVLKWTQADVHDQFAAGRSAMMINGPWRIPALNKNKKLHWGVTQVPVPRTGETAVTRLGGEVWTVPQNPSTARQKKAAQVLSCLNHSASMLTPAEQHHRAFSLHGGLSVRRAGTDDGCLRQERGSGPDPDQPTRCQVAEAATGMYTAIQSAPVRSRPVTDTPGQRH